MINYLTRLVAVILICAMSVVAEFFIYFSHIFIFEGFGHQSFIIICWFITWVIVLN